MRWSASFIPTLREDPAGSRAESLLVRAGFLRQGAPGARAWLPLGLRAARRVEAIAREELDGAGGQEFLLPAPHPAEGSPVAAPEEVLAGIARRELRSYRDLPQTWYAVRGAGAASVFACRFEAAGERESAGCRALHDALDRMLRRCGLECFAAEAGPGLFGLGRRVRFAAPCEPPGGEPVFACACGYAALPAAAASLLPRLQDEPAAGLPVEVATPGRKTIAEVEDFLKAPATHQIKSLVHMAGGEPCLLLLRGDHQLDEAKAAALLKSGGARPAATEEIRRAFGAGAGSLGPVGVSGIPVFADVALRGRRNLTCGANRDDFHLRGVTPDEHFRPVWADLRAVEPGEACVRCGRPLELRRGIALGWVSEPDAGAGPGTAVLGADGRPVAVLASGCGVRIDGILEAAVERSHDSDGIVWPAAIAPFDVILTPVNYRDEVREAADRLYAALRAAGLEVLLDDRPERAGVKFKDADLVGIPWRVVIGAEKLKAGNAELFDRPARLASLVPLEGLREALLARRAAPR